MAGIGFDCGTYNLVCCTRDEDKNVVHKREVNAFLEIPLENRFVFNMMKNAGVPLIERDDVGYALGEAAVDMAYTMSTTELKRPMCDGCVNPKEKDAFEIIKLMIHGLLNDSVRTNNEILYYSVPANAINEQTDADYHSKILQAIFAAYQNQKGYKVQAHPINEGLALVYAELATKGYTGMGISCGAGMINICFAMFGMPIFQFAIVNSGDWIDKMAAKATGETIAYINKEKTKVDLSKTPVSLVERAIQTQYSLMIEKTVQSIKKGLTDAGNKARTDKPIDIVIAGGTSSPVGFDLLFSEIVNQSNFPIKVGNIIRPDDPLYSVARGCLVAAENASH
jgi:actin-like ATPase involved in cell morphogenesis